jgi:hypothetical protein
MPGRFTLIRFSCPKCQMVLQAASEQAGAKVSCPKCKFQMQVPSVPPVAKVAPQPAVPTPDWLGDLRAEQRADQRPPALAPTAAAAAPWYFTREGNRYGPYTTTQLKQFAVSGQLLPTDLVWKEGAEGWKPASTVKGLFAAQQPPSQAAAPEQPPGSHGSPFESLATPSAGRLRQAKQRWHGLSRPAKLGIIGGAVAVPLLLVLVIVFVVRGGSGGRGGTGAQKDGSKQGAREVGKSGGRKGEGVEGGGTKSAEYERQYKLGLQMGRTLAKGWKESGKTETVRQHCLKSLQDAEKTINDYTKSYPPASDAVQGPIGYRDGMRAGLKEGGFPL